MNGTSNTLLNITHLFTRTTLPTVVQIESLLYTFAAKKSLTSITKLHANLIVSGLLSPYESRFIPALLASGYALSGHIPYARQLFDELPQRTKRAYNSMIKVYTEKGLPYNALQVFVEMVESGNPKPDRLTYPFVVKACAELEMYRFGLSVHGLVISGGVDSNTFVGNSLLSMYMSFGENDSAKRVFDEMRDKGVVSWNALISGYFKNGYPNESLMVFKKMVDEKAEIDNATVVSVLPACAYLKRLDVGKEVHDLVRNNGLDENLFVRNALVDMYVKCSQMDDARVIFDETSQRDVVTWTSMVNGYIVNNDTKSAISLCPLMLLEGVKPNALTLASFLSACADLKYLREGKTFHGFAMKNNLDSDVNVETGLIDMYAKCASVSYSFRVFNKTSKVKTAPWNAILSGTTENGLGTEAILLFNEMRRKGVLPNQATLKCVLPAYAITTDLKQVSSIHGYLIRSGFLSKGDLATGLIDIYSKCGALEQAYMAFNEVETKERDIILWSVIISGYGKHGDGATALSLFNQMVQTGVQPNEVTFTSALHACSHSGLVDEGLGLFQFMLKEGKVNPRASHYTCIIDLLGRAGRVHEAYELITTMPFAPNHTVWGALLAACVVHENVELGEIAAKWLFELEPENTGNYILMGNIYAAVGRWEEAENVRNMINEIGLRKSPAHSFIGAGHE
ncbi:putative tetratricopeptide-like helical domain superfamily [Helianthus annuus]|uniref:Tetratricopeptide-like helical domain superfamily n=1 Tax=Helianthus annuus TaxID=4232 RepID=A0A9K3HLU4_HELAN|nr:pentatricopeptide repeat-containing protein At5g39350 [Helianthus annuus]KAF5780595.1 putative tetratricopeptide-like helical domain superfamily [Helianthus annuus]KAJ0507814.1 putative tetratricopeptide-like helical domain superfamily [Helianthus annuus]KAJ0516218.1 putative tetratricopeptide-like helical domain superfamily [Helianthus annuus]